MLLLPNPNNAAADSSPKAQHVLEIEQVILTLIRFIRQL
jgi:hypothetical protein